MHAQCFDHQRSNECFFRQFHTRERGDQRESTSISLVGFDYKKKKKN